MTVDTRPIATAAVAVDTDSEAVVRLPKTRVPIPTRGS
jgi:hypothetical protein